MQRRKVKIKINSKASWSPYSQNKFGDLEEVSSARPSPPPPTCESVDSLCRDGVDEQCMYMQYLS